MHVMKLGVLLAAGAIALAGCGSTNSSAENAQEGTVIDGCVIAPNAECAGANLSGADLKNANLSGANLTGADLTEADMLGANLTNANLTDATIWFTDLQDANLERAKVQPIQFVNANLIHAVCADGVMARNSRC